MNDTLENDTIPMVPNPINSSNRVLGASLPGRSAFVVDLEMHGKAVLPVTVNARSGSARGILSAIGESMRTAGIRLLGIRPVDGGAR